MTATGTEQTKGSAKKRRKKSKSKAEPEAPAVPEPQEEVFALEEVAPPSNLEIWTVGAEKGVEHLERIAKIFAESSLVPERYRGKKADCAIVIAMALKHGADILGFMQNVYVVHGQPGMESKLAIALVNNARVYRGGIQFKMLGDQGDQNRACTAFGIDAVTGDRHEITVSIEDANRAGWTKPIPLRSGKGSIPSKWTVMPEMMLRYRSAMHLIRVHHPEILFGMKRIDELEDIGPKEVQVEVIPPQRAEIREAVGSAMASTARPALASPAVDDGTPLSESLAESSRPVAGAQQGGMNGQEPATQGILSAAPTPGVAADGQMGLGEAMTPPPGDGPPRSARFDVLDAPEPTTDAGMREERKVIVTLYTDLVREAGEERKEISKTMTGTLKDECRRLIKAMDLL